MATCILHVAITASAIINNMKALIVTSYAHWVAEDFEDAAQKLDYALIKDYGFDVPPNLEKYESIAWWMNAEHAARLQHIGKMMRLTAPGPEWLPSVPIELTKRRIFASKLSDFLSLGLTHNVWIKPAEAKIDGFEAGWRSTNDVQKIIESLKIPEDSFVQWTDALLSLNHEYRFYVLNGEIVTGSQYLVDDVTYYDGASDIQKDNALKFAHQAVKLLNENQPSAYTLDVALDEESGEWLVIEGNPAWCSGIYGSNPEDVIKVIEKSCYTNIKNDQFLWIPDSYLSAIANRKVPLK